jgi:serine/threonine protein kinase
MGSPQWSAPEILRGEPHDESADTYSYGVLLYEIMSQRLPYAGVDTFQVVMGVITRMLPRPEIPPDCEYPTQLVELMRSCWAEEPAQRPRFSQILDVADEALEQLALRPQLAGGAKTAAKARESASRMGVPGVLVASGWGSDNASEGTSQSMSSTPLDSRDRKVAVTLVDHVPESLSELSFKRGDSIRDIAPAWPRGDQVPRGTEEIWRGKLRGREGTFRRAHVCMSTLIVPLGGVQHGDGVVDDEYDTSNATLLNSCHGFEVFACSPLDGGARVRIAIMRTDSAEWRARSERQLSLMEEMSAIGCGHLIPLLRVVRPPREKRLVMVMPHMAGGDLFDRLERHGPVQEEQARSIAMQLLSGVAQLHGRHILHGDLQPAALLFESTDAQNPAMRIGAPLPAQRALRIQRLSRAHLAALRTLPLNGIRDQHPLAEMCTALAAKGYAPLRQMCCGLVGGCHPPATGWERWRVRAADLTT